MDQILGGTQVHIIICSQNIINHCVPHKVETETFDSRRDTTIQSVNGSIKKTLYNKEKFHQTISQYSIDGDMKNLTLH